MIEPSPTASEIRDPPTIRLNTSRPMKSAPSQCAAPGFASDAPELVRVGSNGLSAPAKIAVSTKTIRMIGAGRAERIVPREKHRALPSRGDVGARLRQFGAVFDGRHDALTRT